MSWYVKRKQGSGSVLIVFGGNMTAEEGPPSAEACRRLMGSDTVDLYADFSDLAGYATDVRRAWIAMFSDLRKQIRSIHLITGSALVKMGVQIFALAVGASIQNYKTTQEFYAKLGMPVQQRVVGSASR